MANTKGIKSTQKEHKVYCSACGKEKSVRSFYQSNQAIYNNDKQYGRFPICKDCIKKRIYIRDTGEIDKNAFKSMLQKLNLPFWDILYQKALMDDRETFGTFITLLNTFYKTRSTEMCWEDGEMDGKPDSKNALDITNIKENNSTATKERILDWGRGFSDDEYDFLDNELEEWKKTYKWGKRAELILLKEICMTLLRIREARESNGDVSKLQKDLQDLMKTASIDPAKANIADNGKSLDAFGVWIKDIETKKPAEWFEDQEKYKDMDSFVPYIKNYIVRPIKNFLTGNRDFKINENIDVDIDNIDIELNEEEDIPEDKLIGSDE